MIVINKSKSTSKSFVYSSENKATQHYTCEQQQSH